MCLSPEYTCELYLLQLEILDRAWLEITRKNPDLLLAGRFPPDTLACRSHSVVGVYVHMYMHADIYVDTALNVVWM
jgi:hypothetical protein